MAMLIIYTSYTVNPIGWGSTTSLKLGPSDQPSLVVEERNLGKFIASAVAGNAVLGSVFYAFPAVVAVCGV